MTKNIQWGGGSGDGGWAEWEKKGWNSNPELSGLKVWAPYHDLLYKGIKLVSWSPHTLSCEHLLLATKGKMMKMPMLSFTGCNFSTYLFWKPVNSQKLGFCAVFAPAMLLPECGSDWLTSTQLKEMKEWTLPELTVKYCKENTMGF